MLYEEMVQRYAPNKEKLTDLVIQAKGAKRTMAQFAADTGISAPTLSRIVNGKFNNPLEKTILEKIFSSKCPEADFSLEILLRANGMIPKADDVRDKKNLEYFNSAMEKGIAIERHARNAIINTILDQGVPIQSTNCQFLNAPKGFPYGVTLEFDFCLHLSTEKPYTWYFMVMNKIKPFATGTSQTFLFAAKLFLLDAWAPDSLTNIKASFVFINRPEYEQFVMRFKGAPIKSAVSAILINAETETVIEETWMSASPEIPSILTGDESGCNDSRVNTIEVDT